MERLSRIVLPWGLIALAVGFTALVASPSYAQDADPAPGPTAGVPADVGDEAAGATHDEAAHADSPNPMEVDLDLAVWTGVVFVLMFLVLRAFAWPQIKTALEERERRIAETIAAAEALQEKARLSFEEHESRLAMTAGEVRELLEEARRDAEHTKSRIVAEARQAAEEERGRSLREIERAKDGAIQELAVASANVAIDLARKVVREQLTPDQQASIVRDALGRLAATTPSEN